MDEKLVQEALKRLDAVMPVGQRAFEELVKYERTQAAGSLFSLAVLVIITGLAWLVVLRMDDPDPDGLVAMVPLLLSLVALVSCLIGGPLEYARYTNPEGAVIARILAAL